MLGPGLFDTATDAAWVPPDAVRERSRLLNAMRRWNVATLADLHRTSVEDPEWFWRAVVEDLHVEFAEPFDRVRDDSAGTQFPQWFPGGTLNVASLCAQRHAVGPHAGKAAVVYEGDNGIRRVLTFAELDTEVRRFAANLAALGIGRGDRVVLFLPVVPEAVVAFLACAMIGAISVPAFTGYGADALASRLVDSGAVALVTADGTTRRGKVVPLKETADEALLRAPDVAHCLVVRHLGNEITLRTGRDRYWDELAADPAPVATVAAGANDPLTIVYTSGTTGRPKGIVHSHAGFAVKAAVDFAYGFDVHDDDVIAWIADMGWLLGPLLIVAGLQLGATVVFTEGVPDHPDANRLWDIVARNKVTLQGIAPTAARLVMAASGGAAPSGVESLRAFASTGEAWDEPTWRWLFETVGDKQRPIVNYTGGTEVGGGLLVSYPFLPMQPASFNGPLPGADIAVCDAAGEPVVGSVGELVVGNTFPGMTHAFWQDRERYLETYWSRWDGIWVHGDLASVDAEGTWRVHGRSDDTIKVSGRRVGPAELEAALLTDPRIVEAAVIGVPDEQRGQRVVAFVVLRTKDCAAAEFGDLVATAVVNVGRSFAPTVHVVTSLPKTKNGKIMRRAIRSQHLGQAQGDLSSLDPATPIEAIPVIGG
ncbi:acetyl-CoA synthetase [Nocardia neocaledoniensis NBRC 108232]|uniref:acetate--CoA ligase n=1 Tax=Nocardia neocaledoniensis TaxID=236511 RepID=A0A317N0X1_9NOCA|nr:AMP-binding protein [Nocardia neocaledoniensis]PWV67570.1 acetyl-CoA synthetase [Nocardia neocaledoniensis]GEM31268.1 acetyl-CoA synthetase [Nocardia neocaledoniensis NBRC 108232]